MEGRKILRQVTIIKDKIFIYKREFAKGLNQKDFISLLPDLYGEAFSKMAENL